MRKAFSGERGKWRYLSKARDALAGYHLYNDSFTRSHYVVSGAEVLKERQAIAAPLNVDDFHVSNVPEVPKAGTGPCRTRACASPGQHSCPPDHLRPSSTPWWHRPPLLHYPPS